MSGLFRAQVMAQQQQRLQGEVSLTQPVSFIGLTALIITLVLCALAFLYFSQYQRKEQLQGSIESISTALKLPAVVISNQDRVLVQIGESVTQGQPLVQGQANSAQTETPLPLSAPFDGTLADILWTTQGHTGSPQVVLSLLPQADTLLAVVYVPVRIIEFITLGQVVNMRIEALPYQRFGVQEGTVIAIGSQVMTIHESQLQPLPEPSYRVVMALSAKHLPLTQGMRLEADISTAPRRLLAWLFEPRVNQKDEI